MSLVRVRAALGEGRTPTNSPCGQESGRPAPSVGLTPSWHTEVRPAATCRVQSRFSPPAAEIRLRKDAAVAFGACPLGSSYPDLAKTDGSRG